jgi:hypothetical protein
MKPSERIKEIADGYFVNYPAAIMFFLDEQAALLETHTIKEEDEMVRCEHGLIAGDECDCGKDYHNEEPATPKKKCCDNCYLIIDSYPSIYSCENINCQCHQEKLQTYFYKVTCGRCEKSIKLKHSCGRV